MLTEDLRFDNFSDDNCQDQQDQQAGSKKYFPLNEGEQSPNKIDRADSDDRNKVKDKNDEAKGNLKFDSQQGQSDKADEKGYSA